MLRLDHADRPDAGGKARTLARARAAGLPVPDGIVVLPREEIDGPTVAAALAHLGPGLFAVRSSADLEDLPGASAAGVFLSVIGVRAEDAAEAVEQVRRSARGEPAMAWLHARGLPPRVRMSVLIQPVVAGDRLGVLHTEPRSSEGFLVEERAPDQPEWGEVEQRRVPITDPLAEGALRLSRLIGAPADVEYALTPDGPVFLQARPLGATPPARDPAGWSAPGPGKWRRDAEHNPDPLSAAQASLVAFLGSLPSLPEQALVHGYLYVSQRSPVCPDPVDPEDLAALWADRIVPGCEAVLQPLEALPPAEVPLDAALAAYRVVAQASMVDLSPSLKRARSRLDGVLRRGIGEPLADHGALLAGTGGASAARDTSLFVVGRADPAERGALLARHLHRHGAASPAWDVALPTDDEAPDRVLRAAALVAAGPPIEVRAAAARTAAESAARAVRDRLPAALQAPFDAALRTARIAATLGEDDDVLFFRAQRLIRRALLATSRRLYDQGRLTEVSQIFDLPFHIRTDGNTDGNSSSGATAGAPMSVDLQPDPALAARNRAAREAARLLAPPVIFSDGKPLWEGQPSAGVLVGRGTTGRAWGPACILDGTQVPARIPPGSVIVVSTLLPSLTWLIPGAAAVVTDHGGALSHGATLAREYGVPAVLGTRTATRQLVPGESLLVDGDAGRVYRLDRR